MGFLHSPHKTAPLKGKSGFVSLRVRVRVFPLNLFCTLLNISRLIIGSCWPRRRLTSQGAYSMYPAYMTLVKSLLTESRETDLAKPFSCKNLCTSTWSL